MQGRSLGCLKIGLDGFYMRLTEVKANHIRENLERAGYKPVPKVMYIRYTKERGDAVFIHHSLNIVRCYANTDASRILESTLGPPNGKVSEHQAASHKHSWFLNGYGGKSTTVI